jgi:tetratricopeptide (TPR) repeat protein/TolB-like protein
MPSIIEGYNYDIFISYRQKDNKYDGWVTEFVDNLKKELESTFKEEISVYFDINPHDGLLETHDVDASLKEKLRCLIFIPIISRTYCDPKSFAWEHEFKPFVELASQDKFGMKIKVANGNVSNRVLPIRIYELNNEDIKLCESVLGSVLRGIEFVYAEPGVNRPLKPEDDEKTNLNKTKYRNQINKAGNAIHEIISGLLAEPGEPAKEKTRQVQPSMKFKEEQGGKIKAKPAKSVIWKYLTTFAVAAILIIAGILVYPKLFRDSGSSVIEKSVALMPFKNLTGDSSNDYLSEMHREASYQELGKISQVKPLRIVGSRTTSALEKDRVSLFKIAKEARLDYLIEGSVLGSGDLEEIMIRLIRIFPDEKLILANNYSISRTNIHLVHKAIAEQIVRKMGLDLLPEDLLELSQPKKVNPQSHEAYIRGLSEIEKGTREGNEKGLEYLHEAVRIAPDDAFANAGIALGYLTIAHSPLDPGDALVNGEKWAFRAFMLDSTIAEVHAALAIAYQYNSWRFDDAEKHFKRALELNPNLDMAHYHYAWGLHLWGRDEEAIAEHKLAQKYDPFNPLHTAWLGELYRCAGRYVDAIQEALKSMEIQKDYMIGYIVLGRTYADAGRYEEAIKAHQKLAELYPGQITELCLTYIAAGKREEAEKILAEIEKKDKKPTGMGAYNRAKIYGALGMKDEAFKWLNYEPHHGFLAWSAVNKNMSSLHNDPRWNDFLKKVNLPRK